MSLRRNIECSVSAYLKINGIPVQANGRYIPADPGRIYGENPFPPEPAGIEDLTVFYEATALPYPEEDMSDADGALCIEALLDCVHRQDED